MTCQTTTSNNIMTRMSLVYFLMLIGSTPIKMCHRPLEPIEILILAIYVAHSSNRIIESQVLCWHYYWKKTFTYHIQHPCSKRIRKGLMELAYRTKEKKTISRSFRGLSPPRLFINKINNTGSIPCNFAIDQCTNCIYTWKSICHKCLGIPVKTKFTRIWSCIFEHCHLILALIIANHSKWVFTLICNPQPSPGKFR